MKIPILFFCGLIPILAFYAGAEDIYESRPSKPPSFKEGESWQYIKRNGAAGYTETLNECIETGFLISEEFWLKLGGFTISNNCNIRSDFHEYFRQCDILRSDGSVRYRMEIIVSCVRIPYPAPLVAYCPPEEYPFYTVPHDENNDGKIDACYLPFVEDPICDDLGDSLTEMDSQTRAKLANLLNDVRNEVSSHSVALNGGGNKCGLKSLRKRLGFKSIKNKNFKKFVSQLKNKVNTIEGKLSGNIDDFSGAEIGVPRILAADLSRKGVEGRLCTITGENAPFSREDLVLDKNQINKYGDYFVSDKELRDTALHEYGHSAGGVHIKGEGENIMEGEISSFNDKMRNFSKLPNFEKIDIIETSVNNPYVFNSLIGDLGCD